MEDLGFTFVEEENIDKIEVNELTNISVKGTVVHRKEPEEYKTGVGTWSCK